MLKRLLNRCCWPGCWLRATRVHTEMWGIAGIRMFGRAELEFHECDEHWEKTEASRAQGLQGPLK